jgi:hypothetical protein
MSILEKAKFLGEESEPVDLDEENGKIFEPEIKQSTDESDVHIGRKPGLPEIPRKTYSLK